MFKYEYEEKVVDVSTGYTGKIIGKCEYQTGEVSYLVAGIDSTGRPVEDWIHEKRLVREVC